MPKPSKSKNLRSKRGGRAEGAVSRTPRKPPAKTRTSAPLKKPGCTNGANRRRQPQAQDPRPASRSSVQCCAGSRTHAGHVAHQLGHVVDVAEGALARSAVSAARRAELRTHLNELHASLDQAFAAQAADCLGVAVERELNHWEAQHAKVQQTQQEASAKLHEARRELSSVKAKHVHVAKALAEAEDARDRCRRELLSAQTKVREYKENHDGLVARNGWLEDELVALKKKLSAAEDRTPGASAVHLERLRSDLVDVRGELASAQARIENLQTENDVQLADWKRQAAIWGERNAKLEKERNAATEAYRAAWAELNRAREELGQAHNEGHSLEHALAEVRDQRNDLRAELERTREQLVHACAPELTPDTIGAEAERVVRLALEDHAHIDAFAGLTLAILRRTERERDALEQRLGALESSLRIALEDHRDG